MGCSLVEQSIIFYPKFFSFSHANNSVATLAKHFNIIEIECIVMFRNKDDITLDRLMYAKLFILAGPREKISASEVRSNE